jgi:hypothetical protein
MKLITYYEMGSFDSVVCITIATSHPPGRFFLVCQEGFDGSLTLAKFCCLLLVLSLIPTSIPTPHDQVCDTVVTRWLFVSRAI